MRDYDKPVKYRYSTKAILLAVSNFNYFISEPFDSVRLRRKFDLGKTKSILCLGQPDPQTPSSKVSRSCFEKYFQSGGKKVFLDQKGAKKEFLNQFLHLKIVCKNLDPYPTYLLLL